MYILFQFTVADLRPLIWKGDKSILKMLSNYRDNDAPIPDKQSPINFIRNMGKVLSRESKDKIVEKRMFRVNARNFIKLDGFTERNITLITEKNKEIEIKLSNQNCCYREYTSHSMGVVNRLTLGIEFDLASNDKNKIVFELLKTLLAYKVRVKNMESDTMFPYDDCKIGDLTEYLRLAVAHSFIRNPKNKGKKLEENLKNIVPLQPLMIVVTNNEEKKFDLPKNIILKEKISLDYYYADIYQYVLEKNNYPVEYNFCVNKIKNKNYTPVTTVFFAQIDNSLSGDKPKSDRLSLIIRVYLSRLQAEKDCLECVLTNQRRLEKYKIQEYLKSKSGYFDFDNNNFYDSLSKCVFNDYEKKEMSQEVRKILDMIPADSIFKILE